MPINISTALQMSDPDRGQTYFPEFGIIALVAIVLASKGLTMAARKRGGKALAWVAMGSAVLGILMSVGQLGAMNDEKSDSSRVGDIHLTQPAQVGRRGADT